MGEAKRRKQAGQSGQSWKGSLPDALFVRLPSPHPAITLCGNFHILQPPPDDTRLKRLASKLADGLMDPAAWPRLDAPDVLPLWRDPAQGWHYGLAENVEIKRLLRQSAIVHMTMSDHGEQCVFVYEPVEDKGQNQLIADGLLLPRWGGGV